MYIFDIHPFKILKLNVFKLEWWNDEWSIGKWFAIVCKWDQNMKKDHVVIIWLVNNDFESLKKLTDRPLKHMIKFTGQKNGCGWSITRPINCRRWWLNRMLLNKTTSKWVWHGVDNTTFFLVSPHNWLSNWWYFLFLLFFYFFLAWWPMGKRWKINQWVLLLQMK